MILTATVENFTKYSNFRNLKDFNNNIEMFLACHKDKFTKSEFTVFRRLTKFAAKVPGVANASIRKILLGTQMKDFKLGVSESTFHRMKRKAIKLGILEVHSTMRKNESQSSNLWVFKRFDGKGETPVNYQENKSVDTPRTKGEHPQKSTKQGKVVKRLTSLKTVNLYSKTSKLNNNKRIEETSLNHTYTADYVPKEFVQVVRHFFDNAKVIEEYWRMVKIDTYSVKRWVDERTILFTAIHSFKQMIGKLKKGMVKNPIAYFKGVLHKQIDKIYNDLPMEIFE